jgi:putative ABC transport system permease protein
MAILILALSIGAAGAVFSFVDAVFFKPLPYSDPSRIVRLTERRPSSPSNAVVAPLNYLDWKDQNTVFEKIAARTFVREALSGNGEPTVVLGTRVTSSYFDLFGIAPALGRLLSPEEEQPGKDNVVVLSNRLWSEQFGSDPNLIGHSIVLGDKPYIVVGVLPKGSPLERDLAQFWRPLTYASEERTRGFHFLFVIARLKQEVTLEQARAEMDAVGARIARDHPDSNKGWSVNVDPYVDVMTGPHFREALHLWSAAVATLLLIGIANLVNLVLARATTRSREVAIRMALGAGRLGLIGQLFSETFLVSLAGGLVGLALAYTIVAVFRASLPEATLPREADVTLDLRVLIFMFVVSVVTGVIVGLAMAVRATSGDLLLKINRSGRTSTPDFSWHRLSTALVITEVALSFAMLIFSCLLVLSFVELMNVDPGFDEAKMLTMWLTIPQKKFSIPAEVAAYLDEIVRRLNGLPGVQNAAATAAPPLDGWGYGMPVQVSGNQTVDVASRPIVGFKTVSRSYFDTVNLKMLRGRQFSKQDTINAPPVAVISATMAKNFFNDKDPIGQHLLVPQLVPGQLGDGPDISWDIVGVVSDERVSLFDPVSPGLYVPIDQSLPMYVNLVVRTNTPAAFLQPSVPKLIHEINRDQAIYQLLTVDQNKRLTMTTNRQQTFLLVAFTAVAVLLGAIGIYALISFLVTQQTGEIGIRMALGSTPALIIKLVLARVMSWTVAGAILGVIATFGLIRALHTLMFGISEYDPWLFLLAIATLVLVSVVAAWLPARRAARIDPMVALRAD